MGKDHVLVIKSKWTDQQQVYPTLYTKEEAEKEQKIKTNENVVVSVRKLESDQ